MKLTMIFLTAFLFHASARSIGQNIVFSGKNISLEKVFSELEKQTGFYVLYTKKTLENAKPVSILAKGMSLTEFLDRVFENQSLGYTISSKTITIYSRADVVAALLPPAAEAYAVAVNGFVNGDGGKPLSGANIAVKGSKVSATSGIDGRFTIQASAGDILVISYVGYEPQEITLTKAGLTQAFYVRLSLKVNELDETVIIGYGTTSRRFSVGAVSTVNSETIQRQPVTNVLLALQGQVPGLLVTPTTGAPGSAVKLQIRGQNTLASNSGNAQSPASRPYDQPLIIMDGVPTAAQNNSLGHLFTVGLNGLSTSRTPGNGISPFSNINPSDIESISVLRDADATSIYGSQGANGVILITTKKGRASRPGISIRLTSGITASVRPLEMLNTDQYLAMRRDALTADNITLTPGTVNTYPDLQLFDQDRNVNWYNEFFNNNPVTTDLHVSFSGGPANSNFVLSGGYTHTPYNFPGDFKEDRLSLHSSYNYRSPDNKLGIQFVSDYSYTKNNAGNEPRVMGAMTMPPNYPALIDDNNKLVWNYKGVSTVLYNQYANLRQPAEMQLHTFNHSVRLSYQILPGLSVSSNIGYNRTHTNSYSARPLAAQDPGSASAQSSAAFVTAVMQAVNVEPQLDYKLKLGAGELSVLAGGTYRRQNSTSVTMEGRGYSNDDLLKSVAAATTLSAYNSNTLYKYAGGYTRIGYIYNRKYILNITGRRDGSTNFGPGRRWGAFGSAGAGWIFSQEKFWPKSLSFLSFGKLAANYGTNGSDGIAAYNYQAYYQITSPNTTTTFQGIRAYTPGNLYNPIYSWSMKKSVNVSLNLGFLKDRLMMNIDWYQSRTSDQLLGYTLPGQVGFASVLGNFPATVQNNGLELSLSSTNIEKHDFKWTSNFNISGNRNKLVEFANLESSPYALAYVIGKSINIINGYRYAGLDANTGLFTFYNAKGDITSRPNSQHITKGGDMEPLFDLNPSFTGGLGNTISYKGISLTLFVQFSKQRGRNWLAGLYSYGMPGSFMNLPVQALDYWKKPGDQTTLQKLTATGYGSAYSPGLAFVNSTGAYSDASYARLKTVSLTYSLPDSFIRKLGMRSCNIYANAQNLFTVTGYKVADPEMAGAIYTLPLQRNVVLGINVNF